MTRTVEEWTSRLAPKSLTWLVDQRLPVVRGANGKNYDDAIDALISHRIANGEYVVQLNFLGKVNRNQFQQQLLI